MSHSKKRWAWKPKHRRACHKQYWYAPESSGNWMRYYWSKHRGQERAGYLFMLADTEADYSFPFHHRHGLAWTWC